MPGPYSVNVRYNPCECGECETHPLMPPWFWIIYGTMNGHGYNRACGWAYTYPDATEVAMAKMNEVKNG